MTLIFVSRHSSSRRRTSTIGRKTAVKHGIHSLCPCLPPSFQGPSPSTPTKANMVTFCIRVCSARVQDGDQCVMMRRVCHARPLSHLRVLTLTPRRRITQKKLSATNPSCYSRKRLVANSHTAVKTSGMTHTRTSSTASDLTRPPCLVTTRYRPANSSLVQTFSSP